MSCFRDEKGSNMGFGQIIYATILEFSTILVASYDHVVSSVRLFCFN